MDFRQLYQALLCTTACLLSNIAFVSAAHAAFDVNAGAEQTNPADLPDTSVLYSSGAPAPRPLTYRPLYTTVAPPAIFAQSPPATPVAMPTTPMVPPTMAMPAPPMAINPPAITPAYSAASPQTTTQAYTAVPPMAAPANGEPGFIAPAPVLAPPPPMSTGAVPSTVSAASDAPPSSAAINPAANPPMVEHASVAAAPPPAPEALSDQTKTILSHIPSKLDTAKPAAGKNIALNRVSPDVESVLGKGAKDAQYESVGLSIKVRRPGLDTNFELNRAYTALMGGDTDTAIGIYKNILSTEPGNQDALFGLAATYQRLGDIEKARPLYGMLLKVNPNHREGLNNFLVLVSDESPQEALAELERLEQRNPDFSPIPAQEAIVLNKLGYADQAREKMLRAIDLAPDNLTYKYNLAVMLDSHGNYADASALYRLLIDAALKGQPVPSNIESMQKRLNYITANATPPGSGV